MYRWAILRLLSVKLKYLEEWTESRRKIAQRYTSGLSETYAVKSGSLVLPKEMDGNRHVYHQYTIRAKNRDDLQAYLKDKGISSTVYYPLPLHLQKVFSDLGYKEGDFPNSEEASKTVLSLPMFPELKDDQVDYVVDVICAFSGF